MITPTAGSGGKSCEHIVDRNGARLELRGLFKLCVDRDQVVASVHLQAVAGIIDDGDVGIEGFLGELVQKLAHCDLVQVQALDDGEAGAAQRLGHQLAIANRVRKGNGMDIGAVADHQRDLLAFDERPGIPECEHRRD